MGDLLGVRGQTIKHWVRRGRPAGYRVGGRIMLLEEAVAEYARRARGSLDMGEVTNEAAARLVAEGRRGR